MSDAQIWGIGLRHVLPERQASVAAAKIHARADFNAAAPFSLGLAVRFDEPPPSHVLIAGWPSALHERLLIAQELAARAFLRRPDEPLA